MEPWLTKESITFLDRFFKLNSNTRMLEFGSGNSTQWFAQRVHALVSVDHDIRWHTQVQEQCAPYTNVTLYLIQSLYYTLSSTFPDNHFDIILVDGKDRVRCIQESIRILKPGGILMLDDAERKKYRPIFELLKNWPCTITEENKPNQAGELVSSQTVWWVKPQ